MHKYVLFAQLLERIMHITSHYTHTWLIDSHAMFLSLYFKVLLEYLRELNPYNLRRQFVFFKSFCWFQQQIRLRVSPSFLYPCMVRFSRTQPCLIEGNVLSLGMKEMSGDLTLYGAFRGAFRGHTGKPWQFIVASTSTPDVHPSSRAKIHC